MKNLKYLALIALLSMITVNLQAQETKHQHLEHLTTMLEHYMEMKNALTENNFEQAKLHLKKLKKEVLRSSEMKNHPKHVQMHKKHHAAMVEAITSASEAETLKEFRIAFAKISQHLIKAVQNQNYNEQLLYVQFCPMAVNGKGVTWLSAQKEIANPYLGQKMPGCGETKKEIEPAKLHKF